MHHRQVVMPTHHDGLIKNVQLRVYLCTADGNGNVIAHYLLEHTPW